MITCIIVVFILAYLSISLEAYIHINKAATALIGGVLCWTIYILFSPDPRLVTTQLGERMGELSGILFFLLGAMTVVELIDAYGGFDIVTARINQTGKRPLLWSVSLIAFFLSPVLDNLTTCIVMVSLLRKLVDNPRQRLVYIGMVIIAVNAGGVWSPMGDVTTTMLWIGNQVTARSLVLQLFLPSLACLIVPLILCSARMHGTVRRPSGSRMEASAATAGKNQYLILIAGVLVLLCVPLFKMLTGLPPFMGMLIGLGILWIITELVHDKGAPVHELTLTSALQRIDSPSILFFLGILLSVGALEATGILHSIAGWLDSRIGNQTATVMLFGILSSVVDNVPLVAASQAMYGLDRFATDHSFWMLLTYATGTGGSILLIGSAAGVAAMGMESIQFGWYLKKITPLALSGFLAGVGVYLLQKYILAFLVR